MATEKKGTARIHALLQKGRQRFRGIVLDGRQRVFFSVGGAVLLLGGIAMVLSSGVQRAEKITEAVYQYELTASSDCHVHLYPNQVYPEEWLSGRDIYPARLTEGMMLSFHAELQGDGSVRARTQGSYELSVVMRGYYSREAEKKTVFEKTELLESGEIPAVSGNRRELETRLSLSPSEYAEKFAGIEEEIGGGTERECYLLFHGVFRIETEEGRQEKEFSQSIPLPSSTDSGFFTVLLPEEVRETGEIRRETGARILRSWQQPAGGVLLAAAGIALLVFTWLLAGKPGAEAFWKLRMRRLLRRYGSRLVYTASPQSASGDSVLLQDMESLLLISEELREPVLCCLDAEGLPMNGEFLIQMRGRSFLLRIPKELPL